MNVDPGANTTSKREKARMRKQKQRQLARENARLAVLVLAAKKETIDESISPGIMRHALYRSDGSMLIGPRVTIDKNNRPTRSNPIENLVRHSPLFNSNHLFAAKALQSDYDESAQGVNASGIDLTGTGGGGSSDGGGHRAILAQIKVQDRLQGALGCIGSLLAFSGVARVVLHGCPVHVFAEEARIPMPTALIELSAALIRVGNFYNPPSENTSSHNRIRSAHPARVSGAVLTA
jgi:hypothetical protein